MAPQLFGTIRQDLGVGDRNGDQAGLQTEERRFNRGVAVCAHTERTLSKCGFYLKTVSVHEYLGHKSTAHIHVLNLLWSDVLPLSQLEDVLLAVNNLQNSTLFTNVQMAQSQVQLWGNNLSLN